MRTQDSRFQIPDSARQGQSLFEVVVALGISALIIVGLVSLVSNSIRNSTFSKNKTVAARYSQELVEWLRGQRDNEIATFETNVQTPVWCFSTLAWSNIGTCLVGEEIAGTPFKREASFSSTTVNGKTLVQADVVVYWEDAQGQHEVRNVTNFADWRQR